MIHRRRPSTSTAALRKREEGLPLTDVQLTVLELLSHGLTLPAISRQLTVSVNTVKTHCRRLYARLGASNAPHAVRVGFEAGLLSTDPAASRDRVVVRESDLEDELEDAL